MLNEQCDIINNTISPMSVIIDDSNPNDTTEREEGGNDIEDEVDSEPDDFEYSNGTYEDNSISERIIENNEKSNDINVDYYSDKDTDENENCMYFDDSESEDDTDVRNPYLL